MPGSAIFPTYPPGRSPRPGHQLSAEGMAVLQNISISGWLQSSIFVLALARLARSM